MGKMVYLKISKAVFVEQKGNFPIYKCEEKYYIGLEGLYMNGEEVEHCIECESLEEVENECNDLSDWKSGDIEKKDKKGTDNDPFAGREVDILDDCLPSF